MKKIDWKILILTSIICILPMFAGVILYNKLPETMPIHFNINDEVDRVASKNFVLFGMPAIILLFQIFCCIVSDLKEGLEEKKPKFIAVIKWVIPVISVIISFITIEVSLGAEIKVGKMVCFVLGLIYVIIGNYMPKANYNQIKGILHPMPKDEEKAKKFIRNMGYTGVIFGILLMISVLFKTIVSVGVIFAMIIILIIETLAMKK